MSNHLQLFGSVVFAAVLIFFIFLGPDERVLAYRELVDRHSVAEAKISGTECDDHGHVFYEFAVKNKRYIGSTYWLGRPCDSVRIGESVSIFFDPNDPTVNTTMRPDQAFDFHRGQLLTKIFAGSAILFIIFYPIARKWTWFKRLKTWVDGA